MSEELDLLREIGAQKIYEDTHISLKHAQSVIHESFEGLTKVQFLGFISILEREYHQDLSTLRAKGLKYFEDEPEKEITTANVFIETNKSKNVTPLYIFVALVVFVLVAYFSIESDSSTSVVAKIDNSAIVSAQKTINSAAYDLNTSDSNSTLLDENETIPLKVVEKEEDVKTAPSLKIIAKNKLWIGYIDRTEDIKKQTIIEETLGLDPNKEWLLSLGHGNVDIAINGELQEFNTPNNLRFLYKNGKLEKLNFRDFKILNEGRVW